MGTYNMISDIIYEKIEFEKPYTADNLLKICQDNSITLKKSALYNIVHLMKKNHRLTLDSDGKYLKSSPKTYSIAQKNEEINRSIDLLNDFIKSHNKFDWINCSQEELLSTRSIIKDLKLLATYIDNSFNVSN